MRLSYVIALAVAVIIGVYATWSSNRLDSTLAPYGLAHQTCSQVLDKWYCGADLVKMRDYIGVSPITGQP